MVNCNIPTLSAAVPELFQAFHREVCLDKAMVGAPKKGEDPKNQKPLSKGVLVPLFFLFSWFLGPILGNHCFRHRAVYALLVFKHPISWGFQSLTMLISKYQCESRKGVHFMAPPRSSGSRIKLTSTDNMNMDCHECPLNPIQELQLLLKSHQSGKIIIFHYPE